MHAHAKQYLESVERDVIKQALPYMKGLFKLFDKGSTYMPGSMLSSLHPFFSLLSTSSYEISSVITLILTLRELRVKEIK